MSESDLQPLDGNAAAGLLGEMFWRDMTTATGICAGCGSEGPFAEARLFASAMGSVLRCPHCDNVLLRAARTPRGVWLDMQGFRSLTFTPTPDAN
ncbi:MULTISPECIES: DUF6510 family protein [Rhodomicrobium]|uniref:DUF6510 family protein n=1 Tax=Rhodomicrobium TaxID=1068 RepID=UPI000B4B5F5E|nr:MULTISPECIES: DUF6510 family protein [Rhodomicrobium]